MDKIGKEAASSALKLLRDEISAMAQKEDFDDRDACAIKEKAELCAVIIRRVKKDATIKKMPSVREGYIGVREVCELFGRSRAAIYMMIAEGRLPKPLKDGKRNIWDRKEIQRHIEHAKFTRKR